MIFLPSARASLSLFLLLIPLLIRAQDSKNSPVTTAYALTNTTLISAPGDTLQKATILIENGLIREVGRDVGIPVHAQVIACDSLYVYAGFIDAMSHTGIPDRSDEENEERPRVQDPGNPPNDAAGIRPDLSACDVLEAGDRSIGDMREIGFAMSHVVPEGRMLPGKGALIVLNDDPVESITVRKNISMYAQFRGGRGVYPRTVIGVMAKWRDLYRQAELSKEQQEMYEMSNGIERPKYDAAIEGMFPVVSGEVPVFFNTANSLQMHQALRLQKDLGFDLVMAECKQGWRLTEELTRIGKPVIVSLDLPEDKSDKRKSADKKKSAEAKPSDKSAGDEAADNETVKSDEQSEEEIDEEKEQLLKRRSESLKAHYAQAATLHKAGIPIAFSTVNTRARDIRENLRKMIEHGLPEEAALAALTTIPAQLLGIETYAGTVERGKMANLVVSTEPYFNEDAGVKFMFVEGTKHEFEPSKKKARRTGDSDAEPAQIAGKWSFAVDIPDQKETGTFTIYGEPGNYTGTLSVDNNDEVNDLYSFSVNGNLVTFYMDLVDGGQTLTIEFVLEVATDFYEGDVTITELGTFPITGEKLPD